MRVEVACAWATGGLLATLATGCAATTVNECYYYYGYSYGSPFCEYDLWQPWLPIYGYSPVGYFRVEPEPTPHPLTHADATPPDPTVEIDAYVYVARLDEGEPLRPAETIDDHYPCGLGLDVLVLCQTAGTRARNTDYLVVAFEVRNALPFDATSDAFEILFAFDGNAQTSDGPSPAPNEGDLYVERADQWYIASYDTTDQWAMTGIEWVDDEAGEFSTEGRIVIEGEMIALIVPADEFSVEIPRSRVAVLRYRGDGRTDPDEEWSAAVFPPMGEPMVGL